MKSVYLQLLDSPNRKKTSIYFYLFNLLLEKRKDHILNLLSILPESSALVIVYQFIINHIPHQDQLYEILRSLREEDEYFMRLLITTCLETI
jgi:hypothetical protein